MIAERSDNFRTNVTDSSARSPRNTFAEAEVATHVYGFVGLVLTHQATSNSDQISEMIVAC
jgi:hypothetical protein